MAQKLFLDALISRDDFDIQDESHTSQGPHKTTLSYTDFEIPGFFFSSLRKPDFQRETNEWDAEKVKDLIESFLDGDLVPAIILWKYADSYTFVIDGAHRISAIAAWVNDDYGDGKVSRKFFENSIPENQIEVARKARELINRSIGAFKDFKEALYDAENAPIHVRRRLKNFGTRAIQLQWVDGDSKKAESSFFKINQKSTPISDTEIQILESRRQPSGICSRAILRGGQGFKYWDKFDDEISMQIQDLALDIHSLIFKPEFSTPIKTLDLPLGGKNHAVSSLSMVFELVRMLDKDTLAEDNDGKQTLDLLKKIKRLLQRVNDNVPFSLGLHPIVYVYTNSGNFRVSCFHALIKFVERLENEKKLDIFTKNRADFETILLNTEPHIRKIVRDARQANKAILPLTDFYSDVLDKLRNGYCAEDVLAQINSASESSNLAVDQGSLFDAEINTFSKATKSSAFLLEAIANASKCRICGGLLHCKSITIDHIVRKEDGGNGELSNAQLAHPYCNTTYKN
jgi:hypothetical protein